MKDINKLFSRHIASLNSFYKDLLTEYDYEGILIHSGSENYFYADDQQQNFRSDPNFVHLSSNQTIRDSFFYISADKKIKLFYKIEKDFWHEPAETPNKLLEENFDCVIFSNFSEIKVQVLELSKDSAFIGDRSFAFEDFPFKSINDISIIREIYLKRAHKTDYEIYCIDEANKLAVKAHKAAQSAFLAGKSEFDIHMAYLGSIDVTDSELPYPNIIALNRKAGILHYQRKRRETIDAKSFLIDAGAKFNGYCSDITRTYSPDSFFSKLIDAVSELKDGMIEYIKPGLSYKKIFEESRNRISQILFDFEILKTSKDEIYENELYRYFFPHGLSHFLGIQVHDVGRHLAKTVGTQFSPDESWPKLELVNSVRNGHVFTVEPGLYFIPVLLDELKKKVKNDILNSELIDTLIPYGGIRIEDNIVIKNDNVINLTKFN